MEDRPRRTEGLMGKPPFVSRRLRPMAQTVAVTQQARDSSENGGDVTESDSSDWSSLTNEELQPKKWDEVFDSAEDVHVEGIDGTFRCYSKGPSDADAVVVFLHGGGHSGNTWSLLCRELASDGQLDAQLVAFDARGHGNTRVRDEEDLSAEQMVADAIGLLHTLFPEHGPDRQIALVGHSMGGAIAARVAKSPDLHLKLCGIVLIDVVEGTALGALPHMKKFLRNRQQSFNSEEEAIRYGLTSGQVKRLESARFSMPSQIQFDHQSKQYIWRTNLETTEKFWHGWFADLSSIFLTARVMKLLVLAGVDRLDKSLTIAHMQGKFQNVLLPSAGHSVHEDEPERLAAVLRDFFRRVLS
eukprot:Plantae.Rhodophyta-Purpureofilum_apyrenoidigerum.ctg9537.p1 GENE.Plantae.Rhodophyta-Purpureofilum_apyrenoidigerum.ctg9537~~Plantae.Rhodophyta-Purpureofilum_apyrenoidigerum.ctg9537.p1  ORF type:complete len:357 (+),score=57.87 Plantae.Rhodophyta-Purpureofilum_apyrenoidigerum.ctg9537:137-1207(+)